LSYVHIVKGDGAGGYIIFRQPGPYLEADTLTGADGQIVGIEERRERLLRGFIPPSLEYLPTKINHESYAHCIAQCHVLRAAHSRISSYNPDHRNALI
jgi:hypothetical protein